MLVPELDCAEAKQVEEPLRRAERVGERRRAVERERRDERAVDDPDEGRA
jgi:hypothetical protein